MVCLPALVTDSAADVFAAASSGGFYRTINQLIIITPHTHHTHAHTTYGVSLGEPVSEVGVRVASLYWVVLVTMDSC